MWQAQAQPFWNAKGLARNVGGRVGHGSGWCCQGAQQRTQLGMRQDRAAPRRVGGYGRVRRLYWDL